MIDRSYLVELDFDTPEDKKNVPREDFVVEIDDCSFQNPTCLMAEFNFESDYSDKNDKYMAMILEQRPVIAEKESEYD